MPGTPGASQNRWWGSWPFVVGEMRRWQIGPLELLVERHRHEWLIRRRRGQDPLDASLEIAVPLDQPPLDLEEMEIDRFAPRDPDGPLSLVPRLADRTVIVRPRSPFHVLGAARVTLFVSSPLWLSIRAGTTHEDELIELALSRPMGTWFGPSTISGEAAYSVRATCRSDLEGVPLRPHRAVTPLHIDNAAEDKLTFERLAVPVPSLTLFADAAGRLWTEAIELVHRDGVAGMAEARILSGAPRQAGEAEIVTSPRRVAETGLLRVFDAMF